VLRFGHSVSLKGYPVPYASEGSHLAHLLDQSDSCSQKNEIHPTRLKSVSDTLPVALVESRTAVALAGVYVISRTGSVAHRRS
jgi:hypothetical protein